MYTMNPSDAPFDRRYAPAPYPAERYALYRQQTGYLRRSAEMAPYSVLESTPKDLGFGSLDQPQTVEQIVASGHFAVPTALPETALISDKRHTSWLGLDDAIGQIRDRVEIYHRNIYELEQGKCDALNQSFARQAELGFRDGGPDQILSDRLADLYGQQRDERLRLWRDTSALRLTLRVHVQQYLSAYRKLSVLEDPRGDAP